jgi:hypothetical protein
MAAGTPLTRLTLGAASVADDLGYVGLSDLARALGDIPADFRVIGGHMVTVLGARWQLGNELYRETGDVDLGITPIVARDRHVVGRLKDLVATRRWQAIASREDYPMALARPPVAITLELRRLNGTTLQSELPFPR